MMRETHTTLVKDFDECSCQDDIRATLINRLERTIEFVKNLTDENEIGAMILTITYKEADKTGVEGSYFGSEPRMMQALNMSLHQISTGFQQYSENGESMESTEGYVQA